MNADVVYVSETRIERVAEPLRRPYLLKHEKGGGFVQRAFGGGRALRC